MFEGRRRATLLLVTFAVVVAGLLVTFAIELSHSQANSKASVEARVQERAVLAGALVNSLFATVKQGVPADSQVFGGPTVSMAALDKELAGNAYLAVLSPQGALLASTPGFTSQARAELEKSGALKLVRSGAPYGLGNMYGRGSSNVIEFAIALPTAYGTRIVAEGATPSAITALLGGELSHIPGVPGSRNMIVDANDTVIASNIKSRPPGYRIVGAARAALGRSSGDRNGIFYDQVPLADSTWRIVLSAPAATLFASVSGWNHWLPWLLLIAFGLMAATALSLGWRVLHSAERNLAVANVQLEAVNEELAASNLELQRRAAELAHDALHDPLTGLPNRVLLADRLEQVLRHSRRDPATGCAVLFLDLDRFKLVNDSFSHDTGDQLLVAIAARLSDTMRPGDTVARLGGDEFTLLLDSTTAAADAVAAAERIAEVLEHPFHIAGQELFVRASIGICLTEPEAAVSELLRNADIAMYHAKRRGGGTHALFDQSMHQRVLARVTTETELRTAVERSLITVNYQPIVDLADGRIRSLEVLARWPAGWDSISPAEFIPIAEEIGLIGPLGHHVLSTALTDLARWRRAGLVDDTTSVSVNISPRQLDDPGLPEQILEALEESGLPAEALILEITESTLMHEPGRISRIVGEVCAKGVGLHLDDFGTGYSSLMALLQFPVQALKIDRSFVNHGDDDDGMNDAIVRSTIALAHSLSLEVIAEGIETRAQLENLTRLGCEYGQGYLLSRPQDAADMAARLGAWNERDPECGVATPARGPANAISETARF